MLIGEKSTFGIEWAAGSSFGGFNYGHFRFWIENEPIGAWDEEVVLGVLLQSAAVFLRFKGKRYLRQADYMTSVELWNYVDRYCNSDNPEEMQVALAGSYRARFLMHEISDDSVSTVCKAVLVEEITGAQRLLWKNNESKNVHEKKYTKLTVDGVIEGFIAQAK